MRKAAAVLLACAACAHALGTTPRIESIAHDPQGTDAAQLLAQADAAWARRADPEQALAAERAYLSAARAAPREAAAYAGAIRAKAFRLGRQESAEERGRLAADAVGVGQLCEENIPKSPLCDYWLAAALGLQARERAATGHDALPHMVELLRRAASADERLDNGGPHRLLALVLLRAPGWPMGPGDPQAALPEAQTAARLAPQYPPNQLALGEALRKNGSAQEAKIAYAEALRLASAAAEADPDAAGWARDAREALQ